MLNTALARRESRGRTVSARLRHGNGGSQTVLSGLSSCWYYRDGTCGFYERGARLRTVANRLRRVVRTAAYPRVMFRYGCVFSLYLGYCANAVVRPLTTANRTPELRLSTA